MPGLRNKGDGFHTWTLERPVLQAAIAAGPEGHLTFIVNDYGKPFSEGGFGNRMRKWCDDAGLPRRVVRQSERVETRAR